MCMLTCDGFEQAYNRGVTEAIAPHKERTRVRAAPAESFAIRGDILTPMTAVSDAYIIIENGKIASISGKRPPLRIIESSSGLVVMPGLIDLHGHPEYNVFSPWDPPKLYKNRYEWRGSAEYGLVIKEPWKKLTEEASNKRLLARYAEIRALTTGVTAIQGASQDYPKGALVRNVDLPVLGRHVARSWVDPFRQDEATLKKTLDDITSGHVKALYIHLAEGVDDDSRAEFAKAREKGIITPSTVIIHGTALREQDMTEMKKFGAKLVWSPQSNLRLYGNTSNAAEAIRQEILVGIGADWLPSGSGFLLEELRVARRVLGDQDCRPKPEMLVRMVTSTAAAIAGLDDVLGKLEVGRVADILVMEKRREDPWESVLAADPSWIELVTIGGDVVYGNKSIVKPWLGEKHPFEEVIAWGKRMLLDTSYTESASEETPPPLSELKTILTRLYPQVGPILV